MIGGLRMFLVLDAFVRVFIWANAIALSCWIYARWVDLPETSILKADISLALHWGRLLLWWVVLFNLIYVAELVVLRLFIPTPKEGRYEVVPGKRPGATVLLNTLLATLTKARLDPPFPGFLVFHVANLPPLCWLVNRTLGPRSRSTSVVDPIILDPHLVQIGRNVVIGFKSIIAGHYQERDAVTYKKTIIEDEVVIGGGVIILGGVHIKQGAVIAAGSVILPNTVVGEHEMWWGVPAKKFRKLDQAPGGSV